MWNLIAEIGAVLSPAISGVLRGATGERHAAVMLNAGILLVSAVIVLFVRVESSFARANPLRSRRQVRRRHGRNSQKGRDTEP
jgi:hypothetical protein